MDSHEGPVSESVIVVVMHPGIDEPGRGAEGRVENQADVSSSVSQQADVSFDVFHAANVGAVHGEGDVLSLTLPQSPTEVKRGLVTESESK